MEGQISLLSFLDSRINPTNLGRSAIDPSCSKIPSVMRNRCVNGAQCFLFDVFIASESSEVEASEVHDSPARPNKFWFGTG